MTVEFQPPPTWANPMLEATDPATGAKTSSFNPVWLKWFVDLTAVISGGGGGNATTGIGQIGTTVGGTTGPAPVLHLMGRLAVFATDFGNSLADGGPNWNFADNELLTGACDGVNMNFHFAHTPNPTESIHLIHKIGRAVYIPFDDYSYVGGDMVTMVIPPAIGDEIYASYRWFLFF